VGSSAQPPPDRPDTPEAPDGAPGPEALDPQQPTADLLILAYQRGVFPMVHPETREIEWYSPDPRGVLPLDLFHVPKTLARRARQAPFRLSSDESFASVIRACSRPAPGREQTWIDERLVHAYAELFERGAAHSVEAWLDGELVGGLYGVHLGGAFFGESMFSRPERGGTDASKLCLLELVSRLRQGGFALLDTQFWTPHLGRFGCIEIPRSRYLRQLSHALSLRGSWSPDGAPAQRATR